MDGDILTEIEDYIFTNINISSDIKIYLLVHNPSYKVPNSSENGLATNIFHQPQKLPSKRKLFSPIAAFICTCLEAKL